MQFTRLHIICLCAAIQFQLIVGHPNGQYGSPIYDQQPTRRNNNGGPRQQNAHQGRYNPSEQQIRPVTEADPVHNEQHNGSGGQGDGNHNMPNPSAQEDVQSTVGPDSANIDKHYGNNGETIVSTAPKPTRHICTVSTGNYDCQIERVHLKKDQPKNIAFGLEHNNNTQRKLTFRDSTLEYLPKSLIDAFPRVTLLNLNALKISSIEPHTFQNAADLQTLYLADNRLDRIGEGTFHGATYLQTLVLSYNEIAYIDDNNFDHDTDLRILYLDHNRLTRLPSFTNTVYLEYLNASHNNLASIEDKHFRELNMLKILDLSFNQLERLDLQQLHAPLDKVDVSFNNLTELFLPPNVNHLDAKNNSLTKFIVGQRCNLTKLNLVKNRLDKLPDLTACRSLNILDLSYNLLEEFKLPTTMSNLEYLRLAHNNLFEISLPINVPRGAVPFSLKVLNLSHNKLSYGPSLSAFRKLQWVLLNDNNFITLKSYADQSHKDFKFYHTANNEWDCKEVAKFQMLTKDKNKDLCAADMQNITGICCRAYNKPYNDRLNQILRDTDFHERQNQKKCPKAEPTTSNQMTALESIRTAIASSNDARTSKLKEIETTKINENNLNKALGKLKDDRNRVDNSKRNVAREIERQRQIYRVAKEGLITEKEMLKRIIKFVQEKDAFTEDLLSRRRLDTEDAIGLFDEKKRQIDDVNKIIEELQINSKALKDEERKKKKEKEALEKKVNKNAPAIHGRTGQII